MKLERKLLTRGDERVCTLLEPDLTLETNTFGQVSIISKVNHF